MDLLDFVGSKYKSIYKIVDSISSSIKCNTCTICEGESVYVMPWEIDFYLKIYRADLINLNEITYFKHNNGICQFYSNKLVEGHCKIYKNRPFCCRLYPLGLFDDNGKAKWGVYKHCPHLSDMHPFSYTIFAELLNRFLGDNIRYLQIEDRYGLAIENLAGSSRLIKGSSRFISVK